jgi:hypothetical protein
MLAWGQPPWRKSARASARPCRPALARGPIDEGRPAARASRARGGCDCASPYGLGSVASTTTASCASIPVKRSHGSSTGLRGCLRGVARRFPLRSRARSSRAYRRAVARRRVGRVRCVRRFGRIPGRVVVLRARSVSKTRVVLSFRAPGTDRARGPAARSYLVKQSTRPIRGGRGFRRAQTLCNGSCRFSVTLSRREDQAHGHRSACEHDLLLRGRGARQRLAQARPALEGRQGPHALTRGQQRSRLRRSA